MADKTAIEWTDMTWNPIRGCSRVSQGCTHCYAERTAARFCGPGQPYEGLIHPSTGGWNGTIKLVPEALQIPWRLTRGRKIFVNSMSDLFHPGVPFEFIAAVFWVMSVTTRHTYQILTKRPERMLEFFDWLCDEYDEYLSEERGSTAALFPRGHKHRQDAMVIGLTEAGGRHEAVKALGWEAWREGGKRGGYDNCGPGWPLANVWLGVSVEDETSADERIPLLLQTPAAVRWISAEPLLGPIDLLQVRGPCNPMFDGYTGHFDALRSNRCAGHARGYCMPGGCGHRWPALDWVVAGGESGPGARPMHPDWARSLRDQCAAAGVPFLFKQWGEYVSVSEVEGPGEHFKFADGATVRRTGKKLAGRTLDGVLHDGYPESR